MLKFILGLALAGSVAGAGMAVFQDQLLYFPENVRMSEVMVPPFRAWPTVEGFRGLIAEPAGPGRGTVIVFHGNAGHIGHRAFYAGPLRWLGFRVILAEYPGYGPREGPLGENSLVGDAERTIALAHRLHGDPLLVIGESLGAAVAAEAGAQQGDKITGLLLITPWDRLESVAAFHYPWAPVGWLLRDRYDSIGHLASFRRPVVVAIAEGDSIVPARFGRALYDVLPGPKQLEIIRGAEHNDWVPRVNRDWWRKVAEFLLGGNVRD